MAVRNYMNEASSMTRKLTTNQKYELYEIVCDQLKRYASDDRIKELKAVRATLEKDKALDKNRLVKVLNGEVGMTADISSHDLISNKKINRKKN